MSELLYCVEFPYGTYTYYDRDTAFHYYEQNYGTKIFSKTKDLFPKINVFVDRPNVDVKNIRKEEDLVNNTSVALRKAVAKYDKKNTKGIYLKLNKDTDKDILAKLENVDNIQGYIKELIKKDVENN